MTTNRRMHIGWLAVLGLGLAATGCHGGSKVKPGKVEHTPGTPLAADAAVVEVKAEQLGSRIDVVGTVMSAERVQISARLSAYVQSVHASAGQAVKKGDVLVTLDDRDIREQLVAAEAQLRQADTEHERTKKLFAQAAATEQMMVAAQSALQAARSQVEQARVMQSYARIAAPRDGVVTERRVEVGDLAGPGQALMSMYDPLSMRLEAAVPVRLVPRLAMGAPVEVSVEYPPVTLKGTVQEIVSEIDSRSRTQTVKVQIEQGDVRLLPGTFGRLWVETEAREHVLVPARAVIRSGQLEMVQVAENGRALTRLVKTGPARGDRVEILSGLKPGERIVAAPPAGG